MVLTSKCGLLPASRTFTKNTEKKVLPRLEFQSCISPAKFTLKPYSEMVNPYRHGCSILCNHPTSNSELRRAMKRTTRAKDVPEDCGVDKKVLVDRVGEVLEEMLLSRYRREEEVEESVTADGDEPSPAETPEDIEAVAAGIIGGQRPILVLDLRRTTSQETVATREGRETSGEARSPIVSPAQSSVSAASQSLMYPAVKGAPTPPTPGQQEPHPEVVEAANGAAPVTSDEVPAEEADIQRRRGKVRKKKKSGKNISVLPDDRGSKEVVGLIEPGETQVSACKDGVVDEYRSGQTSTTPAELAFQGGTLDPQQAERLLPVSDLFDQRTLRHLRRTVTVHDLEAHFRSVWRKVLEEAMVVSELSPEEEMKHVLEVVNIEPSAPENWIDYPRAFAYDRTRFDLPINKDKLNGMTPLEYLRDYVAISRRHNLLYDYVFDKYREYVEKEAAADVETKIQLDEELQQQDQQPEEVLEESGEDVETRVEVIDENTEEQDKIQEVAEQETELDLHAAQEVTEERVPAEPSRQRERFILGKNILPALGEIMSRPFNEEESSRLREMVSWCDQDIIDLRTWIGLCALAERVFGHQFSSGHDPNLGRQQVIEQVDFENLQEKLPRLQLRPDLQALLTAVREACQREDESKLDYDIYGLDETPPAPATPPEGAEVEEVRRVPRVGVLDDDDSDAEFFNSATVEEHLDQNDPSVQENDDDDGFTSEPEEENVEVDQK